MQCHVTVVDQCVKKILSNYCYVHECNTNSVFLPYQYCMLYYVLVSVHSGIVSRWLLIISYFFGTLYLQRLPLCRFYCYLISHGAQNGPSILIKTDMISNQKLYHMMTHSPPEEVATEKSKQKYIVQVQPFISVIFTFC